HTRWPRDWSSDVCSSDLDVRVPADDERRVFFFREREDVGANTGTVHRDVREKDLQQRIDLDRHDVGLAEIVDIAADGGDGCELRSEERRVGKEGRCVWRR